MSDVNLSISQEVVQPIIEAKVSAAVIEAFGGSQEIVAKVVSRVLNEKVDKDGKPSRYSSRDEQTYLQWLCSKAITDAAKQAITKYIDQSNERLVTELQKVMQRNSRTIAVNLINSFIEATKSSWKLKVDVSATAADIN